MATVPTTPEITINNTAEEIRAAIETQAQPPATPAAAPTPDPAPQPVQGEWGQYTKNQDGSYQVTLSTGEVFKGSADEVIAKQAEAHVNTKRWAQEKVNQAQPTPQPTVPQFSAEDVSLNNWFLESLGRALTMTPEQYTPNALQFVGLLNQMYSGSQSAAESAREMQAQTAYIDFCQSCPDFADTDDQVKALLSYLPQDMQGEKPTRIPNAEDFKRAHAMALYDKKYAPAVAPTNSAPQVPRAPLMPSSGVSTQGAEPNPWAMPMDQLKKAAFPQG